MDDFFYLKRAFEIASKIDPHKVAPNPRVGCVIVKKDPNSKLQILKEGVHEIFGGAHAEVMALEALKSQIPNLKSQKDLLRDSTVYLTLEPCDCFPGKKTPSCTDLLIKYRPQRVVVSALDPRFGGKSLEKLRVAGILVKELPLEKGDTGGFYSENLNPFLAHYQSFKKPWITLKIAQSLHGKITSDPSKNPKAPYITGAESLAEVHCMRAQYSAILTTTETILQDDPRLDCREKALGSSIQELGIFWNISNPILIILGKRELPQSLRIFEVPDRKIFRFETLDQFLESDLYSSLDSIMTECGQQMNTLLLEKGLIDELRIFVAPQIFGVGKSAFEKEPPLKCFSLISAQTRGDDLELRYERKISLSEF